MTWLEDDDDDDDEDVDTDFLSLAVRRTIILSLFLLIAAIVLKRFIPCCNSS